MKPPRILLLAEAANPEMVSVPLVGWSLASAIRRQVDAHLVTHVRNREAILRSGLVEGRDFTTLDSERIAAPAWQLATFLRGGEGKGWTTISAINALTYPYFEHLAWRRFGAEIRAKKFDLVHRITPLSPTTISPLAWKCRSAGIPFIVGPLNGGVPWPQGFDGERRKEREWLSYVRSAYHYLPGHNKSLSATTAIIAGSRHTQSEITTAARSRTYYMPENGLDLKRFNLKAGQPGTLPVRFCFIGRLVPYKCPDLAIQAMAAQARSGQATLDILGDGPMMEDLRSLVAREEIGSSVRFHGWLDHRKVQEVASGCHAFLFPSIREFGGGAVLEAMGLGLVPIVVDYGGPGELVNSRTGFKVPIGSRGDILADLRGLIGEILHKPDMLMSLGSAARNWASANFDWNVKADRLASFYEAIIVAWKGGKLPPVDFLEPDHD